MSNVDFEVADASFTCPICGHCVSFLFDISVECAGCETGWVFFDDLSISEVKEVYESLTDSKTKYYFIDGVMSEDDEKLRAKLKAVAKLRIS